jgi:t-SNARE complex subunit (syntaxin)
MQPLQPSIQAYAEDESDDEFETISAEKRLLLEKENEAFLQQLEEDVEEVVKTTQTLHEISSLQSTLTQHLSAQQEIIDSINTDIIESVDYMTNAHKQLKKTEEMFGQARIWIFIFLIVASCVLLFLDYYG